MSPVPGPKSSPLSPSHPISNPSADPAGSTFENCHLQQPPGSARRPRLAFLQAALHTATTAVSPVSA